MSVEEYIDTSGQWADSLNMLRAVLLKTDLQEVIKWGAPCYTLDGKNILGIVAFKAHVAIWFHQGALLRDEQKKLINAQKGVTKAQRQWRFDSLEEVESELSIISEYVEEAMANHRAGKQIRPQREKELLISEELRHTLDLDLELKIAFKEFTKFKQREFVEYIDTARRLETKQSRLEKIIPMIKAGIGLNDKYRKS